MANSCVSPENSFRYLNIQYKSNNDSKNNNPAIIIADAVTGYVLEMETVRNFLVQRQWKRLQLSTEPNPCTDMDSQNKCWLTGNQASTLLKWPESEQFLFTGKQIALLTIWQCNNRLLKPKRDQYEYTTGDPSVRKQFSMGIRIPFNCLPAEPETQPFKKSAFKWNRMIPFCHLSFLAGIMLKSLKTQVRGSWFVPISIAIIIFFFIRPIFSF